MASTVAAVRLTTTAAIIPAAQILDEFNSAMHPTPTKAINTSNCRIEYRSMAPPRA
jgi:hypothetical protein